jgi:hypothetical protein
VCFVSAGWGAVLNMRAWPNGPILTMLVNGTPVNPVGVDGNWFAVAQGGWVYAPLLYCP